jgi:hypothetical protein
VEWRLVPFVGSDGSGPYLANMQVSGLLGEDRTSTLDYNTGACNVKSLNLNTDGDLYNRAYHAASGATPYSVTPSSRPSSIAAAGLLEGHADAELYDAQLRSDWTSSWVAVKSKPRTKVEVTLSPETGNPAVPGIGHDLWLGDRVKVRAEWGGQALTRSFSSAVRLWDYTLSVDEAGNEQATLGLYNS